MTAIITKQNAIDGAFTGGGGSKDDIFNTLHVKGDATIDGEIINGTISTILENQTKDEEKIKALEETINLKSEIPKVDITNYSTTAQNDEKYIAKDKIVNELQYTTEEIEIDKSNGTYYVVKDIDKIKKYGFTVTEGEYAGNYTFSSVTPQQKQYNFIDMNLNKNITIFYGDITILHRKYVKGQIADSIKSILIESMTCTYPNNITDTILAASYIYNNYPTNTTLNNYFTTAQCDLRYIIKDKIVNELQDSIDNIEIDKSNDTYYIIKDVESVIDKLMNYGFTVNDGSEYDGNYIFNNKNKLFNEYIFTNNDKKIHIYTQDATRNSIEIKQGQLVDENYQSILIENIFCRYYNNFTNEHIPSIIYLDNNYLTTAQCDEKYQLKEVNRTITHYCPIEAGEEITFYKVGKPVYMSGHVYKQVDNKWVSSTAEDSTDCICSVVIDGSWKDFVGIITKVDNENGCITFASHGDYLFYVDDANIYQIGDVLLYDGKILSEDYALTLKIQQSIIGKVTAKINEHYLAIFKD